MRTLIILLLFSLSCSTPPEFKKKNREKKHHQSTDESIQNESFSRYQEVFLAVENTKQRQALQDLRITDEMKKWLLRHGPAGAKGKRFLFLGYIETQMRGFYVDRKFTYYVYNRNFDQPIGFYFENGKTYRYTRNVRGKLEKSYLGTHLFSESIKKIFRVKGEILVRPLRSFKKYEQGGPPSTKKHI